MSADASVYLDSSAIVRLVIDEPESQVLRDHLDGGGPRASCALARIEVERAVSDHGPAAVRRGHVALKAIELIRLDDVLIDRAAVLARGPLRTIDALHLAAAAALGEDLAELITYDRRMAGAATALGMRVRAPGALTR